MITKTECEKIRKAQIEKETVSEGNAFRGSSSFPCACVGLQTGERSFLPADRHKKNNPPDLQSSDFINTYLFPYQPVDLGRPEIAEDRDRR